jgi:hypothetical protein
MKATRALLISLAASAALTLLASLFFGVKAIGLFLFLPLGFWFGHSRRTDPAPPSDRKPIEPQ